MPASFENIFRYSSDERVELTNHRSYHQILRSPYLFALARQNVTCNWYENAEYSRSLIGHVLFFLVLILSVILVFNRMIICTSVSIV